MPKAAAVCLLAVCAIGALCGCGAQKAEKAGSAAIAGTVSAASGDTASADNAKTAEAAAARQKTETETDDNSVKTSEDTEMKTALNLQIDGQTVSVAWENNEAVEALRKLAAQAPLRIRMSGYGGFEQVGSLGTSLPGNDRQITTEAGDIVLYAGSQIVVFYGSNSWAYTRLGRITDKTAAELARLLGRGNVTLLIAPE